ALSLFAFSDLRELLTKVSRCRLVLPSPGFGDLALLGSESDRVYRNRLQARWLAGQCASWLEGNVDVKRSPGPVPQSTISVADGRAIPTRVITGTCPLTTEGLGLTGCTGLSLIQVAESAEECAVLGGWFTALWKGLPDSAEAKQTLIDQLRELAAH